jgi:hypothetical protein
VQAAPGQATQLVYRLTATGGYSGTGEVWLGTGANGNPDLFAQSATMLQGGDPANTMSSRRVESGQTIWEYASPSNTITALPVDEVDQQYREMFDGTRVARYLGRLAQNPEQGVRLLPQQMLDGVTVDVVELDGPNGRQTFYFDAHDYLLRGADWTQDGKVWQARLVKDDTMALSAALAHAFTLNAPPAAHVSMPTIGLEGLASACRTTNSAIKEASLSGGKSPLDLCRETRPTMTEATLIAALAPPVKAILDQGVSSGNITPTQEAQGLASTDAQLAAFIAAPLPNPNRLKGGTPVPIRRNPADRGSTSIQIGKP